MNRCILGLDPGKTGAIAFYFTDYPTRISVRDMPIVDKQVDGATLLSYLEQLRPDFAIIEKVGSRPGEGHVGTFSFGRSYGIALGIVQGMKIPHVLVTPQKWKGAFGLTSDKEKSRAMALATFTDTPEHFARKKDEGRAEAALIALYGARLIPADRVAA